MTESTAHFFRGTAGVGIPKVGCSRCEGFYMWGRNLNVFLIGKQSEVFKRGCRPIGLGLHSDACNSNLKQSGAAESGVKPQAPGLDLETHWEDTPGRAECTFHQKWLNAEKGGWDIRL